MAHSALLLGTDGALWQRAGDGGIVFYAPGAGVVLRARFGCPVWASPSFMEWLTCLVALSLLDGWKGILLSDLDAMSAPFRSYTRQPPQFTVLDTLWSHLVPTLLHLKAHHELWLRAQHDTSDRDTLALLNSIAQSLASLGAHTATPWIVPLLPHLVVFHYKALLIDPDLVLDAAYQAVTSAAYFTARCETYLRPDGADFVALLQDDQLPTMAVKRAFAYRVLEWQPPPALDIPMECHFFAFTHPQLARQVRSRCMPAYGRLLWAQAIVLQSVPVAQGMYVSPDGTLYSSTGRPLLRCTWDGLYLDSIMPDTITLSGLWYSLLPPVQRRTIICRVVQALAAAVPDLPTILDGWAALKPRLQAPPHTPQQPFTVSADNSGTSLNWEYSINIASLVHGFVKWRVRCSGPLQVALPVEPDRHPEEATTVLAAPRTRLPWLQAQLAELTALRSPGGYALLTREPPGSAALVLFELMQPHPIRNLWLYVSPGEPHASPLRAELPPTA